VETEEISQFLRDKKQAEQAKMRTLLIEQMRDKTMQQQIDRKKERELDAVFSTNLSLGQETIKKGVL